MDDFGKAGLYILIVVLIFAVIIGGSLLYTWDPETRAAVNNQLHAAQQVDDATRYSTIKKVEDTARAMIASYQADVLTFQQYNGSENPEQQSWADQARMRANKTASTYNSYILRNRYVWAGNVPPDIRADLPVVD